MSKWGSFSFADPANDVARKLIMYHDLTIMTMLALSVGISFFLISFYCGSFWCRGKNKDEKVEFWWAMLPLLWLVVLAYPSLVNLFSMDSESKSVYMFIAVIGHQWYWEYRYKVMPIGGYLEGFCDWDITKYGWGSNIYYGKWGLMLSFCAQRLGGGTIKGALDYIEFSYNSFMVLEDDLGSGEFRLFEVDWRTVVPAGESVMVGVTSADVIHSWSVPSLGIKLDGVPGKHNLVKFAVEDYGVYYGQCSELCGVNHSYMPIVLESIKLWDFVEWAELAQHRYTGTGVFTCRTVKGYPSSGKSGVVWGS